MLAKDEWIATIAMELDVRNVVTAMEEEGTIVSLAWAQVVKDVILALAMDMNLMETKAIGVGGKVRGFVLIAMVLVLIGVISVWETDMKIVLIAMELAL